MSQLDYMRLFASQRLTAALEEILSVFENVIVKYERDAAQCREVISRQHALLCTLHQPLREWDAPLTDCLTQQPSSGQEAAPCQPKDDIPDQEVVLSYVKEEEQKEQQLQKLNNLEIIGFTYRSKPAAKPLVDLQPSVHPQTLNSDPDVQNVLSSETEDSDDYNKESAESEAASDEKQKFVRPQESFSCHVCSRTFKTRRILFKHVKSHQQDAEQVCGLCGEQCHAGEGLTRHLQTHFEKRKLQIQTRSQNWEKRVSKLSENGVEESQKGNKCEETNGSADQRETLEQKKTSKRQRTV
ncbi:zinc finger protein 236 [Oryzias melastigma]|uniref:zinc finger protein 236 n=1 Tax=Oryzias melastigma TaxID=30732 RepID=UPI000CF7F7A8|nr:zinc finger protein 236 [Oryzias melastigma]